MKEDQYIAIDFSDIITDPQLTRRELLKLPSAGKYPLREALIIVPP